MISLYTYILLTILGGNRAAIIQFDGDESNRPMQCLLAEKPGS